MLKFTAEDIQVTQGFDGSLNAMMKISPQHRYSVKAHFAELVGKKLTVSIAQYRDRRSLEQNRMLWALLEIMAEGLRAHGVLADSMECYLDTLEKASVKFIWLECRTDAVNDLKRMYRCVRVIEERKGGKTCMVKAYPGSSTFDTKEMSRLIDTAFLMLSEYGIQTPETRYEYEQHIAG